MSMVERIRNLCTQNKTTIKALERELNIANGSIRNWETNKPSVEKVLLVSQRFNVSIDWLLTGKETADLESNEQELVELYRNTNDIGQPLIIKQAESIQQTLPREKQEQELSDSKIG